MKKLLTLWACLCALITTQPTKQAFGQPKSYWRFETKSVTNNVNFKDETGFFDLNMSYYTGSNYTTSAGKVGSALNLDANSSLIVGSNSPSPITASFTFEVCMKASYDFHGCTFFNNQADGFAGTFNISNFNGDCTPFLYFMTKTAGGLNEFRVPLNGVYNSRKSLNYYQDGNFHHFVFVFDATTGRKEIWVDGQLPATFSTTAPTGNISGNGGLWLNNINLQRRIHGSFDEIAYWTSALPAALIYQHYLNVQAGVPYQNTTTLTVVPSPDAIPTVIDSMEYHPTGMDAITQLQSAPNARFWSGMTLRPNFNWVDPMYMGDRFQPGVSDATAITRSTALNLEIAKNWHYSIFLAEPDGTFGSAWITMANAHPELQTQLISLRRQRNGGSELLKQDKAASQYLRSNTTSTTGAFLDVNGNALTTSNEVGNKVWSPAGSFTPYCADGAWAKALYKSVQDALTRPLNRGNENGEVLFPYTSTTLSKDPAVVAAANAAGLTVFQYMGKGFYLQEKNSYFDSIMQTPGLPNNFEFSLYGNEGHDIYRFWWNEARKLGTKMRNNQYYSTGDAYVRRPNNWRTNQGADHGFQWIIEARNNEIAAGDSLFSPFISAGWSTTSPESDVRPAQWLGFLKNLAVMGAEFFYTGYFNEAGNYQSPNPPPVSGATYAWQVMAPSYVQACMSHFENILYKGTLLPGTYPLSYDPIIAGNGYNFWTGNLTQFCTVRQLGNEYLIALSGNRYNNYKDGVPPVAPATILLAGKYYTFNVNPQGNLYYLNLANPNAPIIYQADDWHESTHYARWGKDYKMQVEMSDTITGTIASTVENVTNLRNYKTVVQLANTQKVAQTIIPKNTGAQYLWVYGKGTGTLNVKWNSSNTAVTMNTEGWYKISVGSLTSGTAYQLTMTSAATHELDKIDLTTNASKYTPAVVDTATNPPVVLLCNAITVKSRGVTRNKLSFVFNTQTAGVTGKTLHLYTADHKQDITFTYEKTNNSVYYNCMYPNTTYYYTLTTLCPQGNLISSEQTFTTLP